MMQNLLVGLALTVIGMGLVFLVLATLAVAIWLLIRAEGRRRPVEAGEHRAEAAGQNAPRRDARRREAPDAAPVAAGLQPDPEEVAAMLIAVRLHQRVRRNQAAPAMRTHQPGTLPSRWLMAGRTRQNRSWQRR